ncbi:hypothetical protein J1N35_011720 [Gossypium stocksii]|uniref:Uncharacterized protein n=1 Tax=Gossypium stocksii TaxID=47602 RepID=A0A9D4ABP9_9ROSI|nr:hypothetical protein J1N35_011720 [Gossypium stocksii]
MTSGYDKKNKWKVAAKITCMQRQPITTIVGKTQLAKLSKGRMLQLEDLLIVRNILKYYLLENSPNGWRPLNNLHGMNIINMLPIEFTRPHDANEELGLILPGKRE